MRDSAAIARDVRSSLAQLPPGSDLNISVAVDGGSVILTGQTDSWVLSKLAVQTAVAVNETHVRLSGSVATPGLKVRAGNITTQIEGVLTLDNQITVAAKSGRPSDADITAAIVEERFWSPYVDGDRIAATVTDGRAILKGFAANRFAAYMAVQNAFEGGAATVQTVLALDGGSTFDQRFTSVF